MCCPDFRVSKATCDKNCNDLILSPSLIEWNNVSLLWMKAVNCQCCYLWWRIKEPSGCKAEQKSHTATREVHYPRVAQGSGERWQFPVKQGNSNKIKQCYEGLTLKSDGLSNCKCFLFSASLSDYLDVKLWDFASFLILDLLTVWSVYSGTSKYGGQRLKGRKALWLSKNLLLPF